MGDVLILIPILAERIEELKADIMEFTKLELEATEEFDMIRYGYKANESRALLLVVKEQLNSLMESLL